MEEVNLEARQYGVGASGGVKHAVLRAQIHLDAGSCVILTDASNAFNSVPTEAHARGGCSYACA